MSCDFVYIQSSDEMVIIINIIIDFERSYRFKSSYSLEVSYWKLKKNSDVKCSVMLADVVLRYYDF